MDGYTKSPYFAWAGWRLRIPGGPVGGQYHGFLASGATDETLPLEAGPAHLSGLGDSRSGWAHVWGGVALREGETVSDYVYRSPGEVQPRPNASGGVNTVRSLQTEKTAGYAEAPGNYRYLGAVSPVGPSTGHPRFPGRPPVPIGPASGHPRLPVHSLHGLGLPIYDAEYVRGNVVTPRPGASTGVPRYPARALPGEAVVTHPVDLRCPSWGCGITTLPYPVTPAPAPTNTVPQPPPPSVPVVSNSVTDPNCTQPGYFRDAAGNCTNDWHNPYSLYLPQSPRPAPTVAASPADFLPSQGQSVPGVTPDSSSSIMDWLSSSSIWSAVPNGVLVGGALVAAFALSRGGRR